MQATWGPVGCLGLGSGASLPEETGTNEATLFPTVPTLTLQKKGAPDLFLTSFSFLGQ